MVVFTNSLEIINNEEITTDVGRNTASITGRFRINLRENQFITDDILTVSVGREGGFDPFSSSFVEIFINGSKIEKIGWPFGRTSPIVPEYEDVINRIKTDGSLNTVTVRVSQSALDGLNRWNIFAVYTYNLNTIEEPEDPGTVEPPEKDENIDEGFFDNLTPLKVAGLVALVGGTIVFASGFGKGLGRSVGSR